VSVEDINDNPPRFTQLFRASVFENASPGTVVLRVTSTDADEGDVTRYSLLPSTLSSSADLFTIDGQAGTISVAGSIDRESTGDVLVVRVAANDGAFNAETTVTIDILDENDVPPACRLPSNTFQTVEDSRLAVVVNVSASDADATSPSRDAVISLADRWSRDFVVVDGGEAVAWRRPVPFQNTSLVGGRWSPLNVHRVTLAAVDMGRPALWTDCRPLTVSVFAENVFSPQFSRSSYSVAVPNNAAVGFTVITLRARCGSP